MNSKNETTTGSGDALIDQKRHVMHECDMDGLPDEAYGEAISSCDEREDGTLWVGNGEYGSRVNFCPKCGYKAKNQYIA